MGESCGIFGTCGWWKLREDHPLQLIANDFAKEHGTPQFPLHVTYSYGNDEFNHDFNAQYADPPWFDPMDMKNEIWDSPDDRWYWEIPAWCVHPSKWDTVEGCEPENIVQFDSSFHADTLCDFHSIDMPILLFDKCEEGPYPDFDGPSYYTYHISLAYTAVDAMKEWDGKGAYGFLSEDDIHIEWFNKALEHVEITFENDDFTAELWDCSSKNVEEWHKL